MRVGGDDGDLRSWHYIYEGGRGQLGTPTMALHIRIQHLKETQNQDVQKFVDDFPEGPGFGLNAMSNNVMCCPAP